MTISCQPASCRLPPASSRLPPASCLLPPAVCLLPPAFLTHALPTHTVARVLESDSAAQQFVADFVGAFEIPIAAGRRSCFDQLLDFRVGDHVSSKINHVQHC